MNGEGAVTSNLSQRATALRAGLPAHLVVLAGFALLALAVTAPLVTCLGTCLGEPPDSIFTVWGFAWMARSLLGPEHLFDGNLFHPYSGALALSEPSLSNGVLAAPLIAATHNPLVGYNVILILQYVAAAFGAYLVVWEVLGRRLPAVFAGVLFAMSSFLVHNAYNLQSFTVVCVPFLVVVAQRFSKAPSYSTTALLWGISLVLAVTSVYFTVYGGLALLCFFAVVLAFKERRLGVLHLKRVALVAPPFLVVLGLSYYPYWIWSRQHHETRSLAEVELYRAKLENYGFVAPTNLVHRHLHWWSTTGTTTSAAFPGVIAAILALLAVVCAVRELRKQDGFSRSRAVQVVAWAAFCAFSFVMAFGPTLRVGDTVLPLPYRLFFEVVPGMSALRTANRFLGLVSLAVAVLAGFGLDRFSAWLATRVPPRAKSALLGATLSLGVAELVSYPYPGTFQTLAGNLGPEHLAFVDWLKAQPGKPSVVELPMRGELALYDAALTGNRFVNGWSSFNPPLYDELVKGLLPFPSDRALDLLSALPVDLVVVDSSRYSRAASRADVQRLLQQGATFGKLQVFSKASSKLPRDELRVEAHLENPSDQATIVVELVNPGSRALALYPKHRLQVTLGSATASTGAQTDLGLWVRPGRSPALSLSAPAVPQERASALRVQWKLSANGIPDLGGEVSLEPPTPNP
jgi:hypothetical protein